MIPAARVGDGIVSSIPGSVVAMLAVMLLLFACGLACVAPNVVLEGGGCEITKQLIRHGKSKCLKVISFTSVRASCQSIFYWRKHCRELQSLVRSGSEFLIAGES